MEGQCFKRQGVDCVRFIAGVMNELAGEDRVCPPRLPQDIAMHDAQGAIKVMHAISEGFRPFSMMKSACELEPADVIIVGPHAGGPGHGMIVGARRNTIWHASDRRVHFTGIDTLRLMNQRIFRVYRYLEKHLWLR